MAVRIGERRGLCDHERFAVTECFPIEFFEDRIRERLYFVWSNVMVDADPVHPGCARIEQDPLAETAITFSVGAGIRCENPFDLCGTRCAENPNDTMLRSNVGIPCMRDL